MPSTVEGFVYVPDEDNGIMAKARAGARISLSDRRPPWIVVDHSIDSVLIARWPGRLWRVRIVDPVNDDDVRAAGAGKLLPSAGYKRAIAVDVVEEIQSSRLFGVQGEAVCVVIAQASQLDLAQAKSLAEARHPDAGKAYSDAWNTWLISVGGTSSHRGEDLTGTLGISAGGFRSPINCGFSVLHRTISIRAESLAGGSAFVIDEEGERYLEPTWSAASAALLEAAMAFGAPSLSREEDEHIMASAWRSVIGPDPVT
jgi:hypothetical protein